MSARRWSDQPIRRFGALVFVTLVVLVSAWITNQSVLAAEQTHRAAHAAAGVRAEINNLGLLVSRANDGVYISRGRLEGAIDNLNDELQLLLPSLDEDEAVLLERRIAALSSAAAQTVEALSSGEDSAVFAPTLRFALVERDIAYIEEEITVYAEQSSSRARQVLLISSIAAGLTVVLALAAESRRRSQRSAQEARDELDKRYKSLIENSPAHIYVVGPDGDLDFKSPAAEAEVGKEIDHIESLYAILDPADEKRMRAIIEGTAGTEGSRRIRIKGADQWFEVHVADHRSNPTIGGLVLTAIDVTARAELEDGLRQQAREDALTGLPNRRALNESLEDAVARRSRTNGNTALLLIDLDGFKSINDTMGHPVGDRVLAAVADRLLHTTRQNEKAARLGGDEFALVLDLSGDDPIVAAEAAAQRILNTIRQPYEIDGQTLNVDASVGIAISAPGEDPAELLRRSDIALYEAKRDGGARTQLFAPEMEDLLMVQLKLKRGLEKALAADQFELAYQPILSVRHRRTVGFEALLRWTSDELGPMSPNVFIPAAEQSGAIIPLGRWTLAKAIDQLIAWQSDFDDTTLTMSVNASIVELVEADYAEFLEQLLTNAGLDPTTLQIEVTESAFAANHHALVETLEAIRRLGVQIALDDFGTGYSSMGQLQKLPVDCLKIDRSFIVEVGDSPQGASVVRAVVELGKALGLTTVAEGVETAEQFAALQGPDCDHAQGFGLARPMRADQVRDFMIAERSGERPALPSAQAV